MLFDAAPPEFLTEEYDTGDFDAAAYLEKYPHVANDDWYGSRPAAHYQYHGQHQGLEYPTIMGTRQVENPAYGEWLGTVPLETVPPETVPPETVPLETVPLGTVPLETVPLETVPLGTVPPETVPLDDSILPPRSATGEIFDAAQAYANLPAPYEAAPSPGLFDLPASPFASSYDQFGIPIAAPPGGTYDHPQTGTSRMATTDPAVHKARAEAWQLFDDSPNDADTGDQATAPGMDEQASPASLAIVSAVLGLAFPAARAVLGPPSMLARGYNYFFDEEEPDMGQFGIDPLGEFGAIGGPPDADDTAEGANADAAVAAANAAATAAGFDVDEVDMAAETSTGGDGGSDSGGGGDAAAGDPGDGAGADSEASGDADSDSGDDADGTDWHLGGLLGGSGPRDIAAEGGEYIIRKSAVKKYGRGLFDDLNESKIGKRQLKGLLDA